MVVLFILAVVAVVIAVDLVLGIAWIWGISEARPVSQASPGLLGMMKAVPRTLYLWGTLGTLTVIFGASLVQVIKLRDGGEVIAQMVGARPVSPDSRDPLERRLLNVVEEMAIASGVRVPKVF